MSSFAKNKINIFKLHSEGVYRSRKIYLLFTVLYPWPAMKSSRSGGLSIFMRCT